jgi:hypothetical protein
MPGWNVNTNVSGHITTGTPEIYNPAPSPGSIRLCWGCDNQLREQTTERLAGIAMQNLVKWILERVNIDLGFSSYTLTLPGSAGGWYATIWLTLFLNQCEQSPQD